MKTKSGHNDYLSHPSYSFYHPDPFPSLLHRLFPPRDPQTLEHTSSTRIISILRLFYVLLVVLPIHTTAALISHFLYSKSQWQAMGWGRGVFPTRLPGWSWGQTLGVPLVGSFFWALVYGTPKGMGWREERTVPWASKWLFGRGHEGWSIDAESVILPPLPTVETSTALKTSVKGEENGLRKCHHCNSNAKSAVERAADATSTPTTNTAPPASPYDARKEGIPLDILRGAIRGIDLDVTPQPVAAFWQWKSLPSSVSHGLVTSVKPGNDVAGIGSGPALSSSERMVLFFVGGGYHSGHAPQGPLSWTVCRQTSLRVLGVNFRKATADKRAFPAALQDALAAWVYVTKRLGFKAENVILMGDSAGGGLALTLQLYLSSLMWSGEGGLGRAKKLVLHSPMTDLTLGTDSFVGNEGVDIISPYVCSLARDNYLRHVMPVAGRKNSHLQEEEYTGESRIDAIASRYLIDPYASLQPLARAELKRLASELPDTILDLGPFHPLFSLGLDARKHRYLAQTLHLLLPPLGVEEEEGEMEMLVTAGGGEIFVDQIRTFVRNILDLSGQERGEGEVKVCLVECKDWHHVFAYMNLPGSVKGEVDDVGKAFMLA
ncbi:hypothetical protein NDA14_001017 [Ustilago hordei]|nr:hypothetical protein NDA14_001017 [Ustilago hordei]